MLNLTEPIDAHGFCSTTDCDGKAGPWPGDSPWTPQTGINSSTVKESNPMIPGPR